MKKKFNYEDLSDASSLLSDFNSRGFDGIELYHDGNLVEFSKKEKQDWEFIGLNIWEFVSDYDFKE